MEKSKYIKRFTEEYVRLSGINKEIAKGTAKEYYEFLWKYNGDTCWPEKDARDEIRALI